MNPTETIQLIERDIRGILEGIRVLVVDDLSDNQLLISLFLRKAGATCDFASSGKEGIEKASQFNFDIVLMDIQMPMMDGHETTRRLRKIGYKNPIVAITAHAMKQDLDKSLEAGCDAHITKPIVSKNLIATISRLVDRQHF